MPDAADGPRVPSRSRSSSHNPLQDHVLPSVELALSYSPSSTGQLTPTSSITDLADHEDNQRALTPTTQALFQNLRLSEGEIHEATQSTHSLSNGQQASGLTPITRRTTYMDLYNATPAPESARTTGSQETLQTPTSPLGGVSSGLQNLILAGPDEAAAEVSDENSSSASWHYNGDRDDDGDHIYNVREEELPRAPIYDIRLQNALRNVRGQIADLAQFIGERELTHDPTSDIHGLYDQLLRASRFSYPATRTVGFIGKSGAGESPSIRADDGNIDCFWQGRAALSILSLTKMGSRDQ